MFFFMGLMIGPMYTLINDDTLVGFTDEFPEALLAVFGGGDMSTAGRLLPARDLRDDGANRRHDRHGHRNRCTRLALANEEQNVALWGLLLANPVKRSTVVYQKTAAMVANGAVVGVSIFAGVAAGSLLGRLGMSIPNIAATSLLVTLTGLVFGALALLLGAATGRSKIASYGTIGIALILFVLNAFLPFNDALVGYAKWSPFYYYLTSDPLLNGMHWGHGAVLAFLTVAMVAIAAFLFDRRDLRQTG